jgi:YD repeat-containing protein
MSELTPDNPPRVGEGMSITLFTDTHAYTVVAVSPNGKTITLQRDLAVRVNRAADTFEPGGFFGHTECPEGQQWTYERDPEGAVVRVTWRAAISAYKQAGHPTRSPGMRAFSGRHEYYDYNF